MNCGRAGRRGDHLCPGGTFVVYAGFFTLADRISGCLSGRPSLAAEHLLNGRRNVWFAAASEMALLRQFGGDLSIR
jgi:hypothetical protein